VNQPQSGIAFPPFTFAPVLAQIGNYQLFAALQNWREHLGSKAQLILRERFYRSMIPKALSDITENDLLALIGNGVAEGRTIDYKRELPGNSDSEKKDFLADVSSFANTSGGDLVYGMDEDRGLPTQIVGVQTVDLDLEIRRMDSMLAAGLSPRIRYLIKRVDTSSGLNTLVLRVERSWFGPHRVILKGDDRFYGRNSAGKYPLDVNELRASFNLSSSATEKIRAFRTERIISLANNETPVNPFVDSPKVILHCIPVEAFAGQRTFDILPLYKDVLRLPPMGTTVWDRRLNLDGVVSFGTHDPRFTYTQLYRTGIIEAVNIFTIERDGKKLIPSVSYEQHIFGYLSQCFQIFSGLGVGAPIIVGLTFTGTQGLRMAVDRFGFDLGQPIEPAMLVLPETLVEDMTIPLERF
jgi:hypothetical protein